MLALDLEIYNNAGNSLDLSLPVLERAMFHSDNVYEIPNVRIMGNVCFTNFPSNTAFRGFGGPQGMLITENWIQRVAVEVRKSPEEIRVSYMSSLIYFSCQVTVFIRYIIFFICWSFFWLLNWCHFQEINFQGEGSILHYGQQLQHCTLFPLWNELKLSCDFLNARKEVDNFNLKNRWKKRGIAMVPTKFGISFTLKLMNQVMLELYMYCFALAFIW